MRKTLPALLTLALAIPVMAIQDDVGEPIKKISFADRIDGWSVIDDRTIVLRKGAAQSYVVHLKTDCRMLKYARNVGVSSSNNTVLWIFFSVASMMLIALVVIQPRSSCVVGIW